MSLSWSQAFKSGFMICIYSCVWEIVGGIIMAIGTIVGGVDLLNGGVNSLGTSFLIWFVFTVIGFIILALGFFASIVKVSADAARGR